MKEILLFTGEITQVSDEDYNWLNSYNWHINKGYASCSVGANKILMHRMILALNKNEEGDHKDRNKLNNQRSNLRKVTRSQNIFNTSLRIDNKTGYRGVYKKRNLWCAQIRIDGRALYLGSADTKIEAAKLYDKAAVFYMKDFAILNFPDVQNICV